MPLTTEAIAKRLIGVYVHVPFCKRKCRYCDFYSVADGFDETAYVNRISEEAESYKQLRFSADSLYFGGGTPSLLSVDAVESIINGVSRAFNLTPDAEITLEANPSSMDADKLAEYKRVGINRLSVGIQSGLDSELSVLGRLHDFECARQKIKAARRAGFENISVDMMLALPNQTEKELLSSLDRLLELKPNHISCYILKLENGTPLFDEKPSLPDDEQTAALYLAVCSGLCEAGFEHYEISSFCKPGKRSRHNLKYWRGEEYIGLGPAAHSFLNGERYFNRRDLKGYLRGENIRGVSEKSVLPADEYLTLSLRLSDGISIERYRALGGKSDILKKLKFVPKNYYKTDFTDEARLRLTDEGFLVSNEIIATLL